MLPKIGQILFIQVNSFLEEEKNQEYKSRISDMNDESIQIEVPIHTKTGKLKRLGTGEEIAVTYMSNEGVNHFFNTSVLGVTEDKGIRQFIVRKPEADSISTKQRRSFLRISADTEIAVKYSEQLQFTAFTEDLGGGGVSFYCEGFIPLATTQTVDCWLLLPFKNGQPEHAFFKGEIVRVKPLETGMQQVMLKYADIQERERQKVIRFCFERQLENRKK